MFPGRPSRPGVQGVDKPRLAPQHTRPAPARVAELVDALASGASGGNSVEVRVLSRAPGCRKPPLEGVFRVYARGLPGRRALAGRRLRRPEERRVGKACVSTCESRRMAVNTKKKYYRL